MGAYETYIENIQPAALARKPTYVSFVTAFGKELDSHLDRAKQAAQVNVLSKTPTDALGLAGQERLLRRFPTETNDQYRARLIAAFPFWLKSGTNNSLLGILSVAFPDLSFGIIEFRDGPGSFAPSVFWPQFDVRITVEPSGVLEQWEIGDDHDIDEENLIIGVIGVSPYVFGYNEFELIRSIILELKPAYTLCRYLTIDFDGDEVSFPIQASIIP